LAQEWAAQGPPPKVEYDKALINLFADALAPPGMAISEPPPEHHAGCPVVNRLGGTGSRSAA
jgi:hypothetical protein